MHETRLLHVLQGPPWDPPQERHELAPVAHTQAECVRPASKNRNSIRYRLERYGSRDGRTACWLMQELLEPLLCGPPCRDLRSARSLVNMARWIVVIIISS